MRVVILCGGLGTRLSEETQLRPKPMVEIGGRPILWHILNIYAKQGFNEFVLALGYKGAIIREYFLNYYALNSDLQIDLNRGGEVTYLRPARQNWKIDLIDTGKDTLTGGRLHRLRHHLQKGEPFFVTYGDGVANVDLSQLLHFHRRHGKIATVTSVRPPARFGNIVFNGDTVQEFMEKPHTGDGWVNGGFFVFEPQFFDYLEGDQTVLEGAPMERLAREGQLVGYRHDGFWQCMDTLRDKTYLDALCSKGEPPWFNVTTKFKEGEAPVEGRLARGTSPENLLDL